MAHKVFPRGEKVGPEIEESFYFGIVVDGIDVLDQLIFVLDDLVFLEYLFDLVGHALIVMPVLFTLVEFGVFLGKVTPHVVEFPVGLLENALVMLIQLLQVVAGLA
jgi:hypothetical protein